jgi:protocatechuate 3,4-dioxygenase, alpha subunit
MTIGTTPSQTVGPFFAFGLTAKKTAVPQIAGPGAKGEQVVLICRVLDGDSVGIADAMVEIWQADAGGKYNHPDDHQETVADPECRGFGRMGTDDSGSCRLETIRPGRVPGPGGKDQAPHLNLAVFARGMLKQFYTRIYFAGDAANQDDPVLALVPEGRRGSLMAQPDPTRSGVWSFDIRLQGDRETVFFDV